MKLTQFYVTLLYTIAGQIFHNLVFRFFVRQGINVEIK